MVKPGSKYGVVVSSYPGAGLVSARGVASLHEHVAKSGICPDPQVKPSEQVDVLATKLSCTHCASREKLSEQLATEVVHIEVLHPRQRA